MKSNRGVTMVEMVVVIIIILMIAIFAVASGRETLDQTDVAEIHVEMKSMKNAVNGIMMKQNINEKFVIEKGKHYDEAFYPAANVEYGQNVIGNESAWVIIYGMDNEEAYLQSTVKNGLGLDSINHTYIVNFQTTEVELYKPIKVANTYIVRTFDEVRSLVEDGKI